MGAIDIAKRYGDRFRPTPYRIDGSETDVRDFRKRVGRPRDDQSAGTAPPRKERILYDDAGHRIGRVSEIEP